MEPFFSIPWRFHLSRVDCTTKHFSDYLKNLNLNSIFFYQHLLMKLLKCIHNLKSIKASGPNSINIKILNSIKFQFSKTLSDLINLSFFSGSFPFVLKLAKVIPVLKKGSKLETQNYRPISLLSNIDKIFQKLMYKR